MNENKIEKTVSFLVGLVKVLCCLCVIVGAAALYFQFRTPPDGHTPDAGSALSADSVELQAYSKQRVIKMGKEIGSIGPVKLYEFVTDRGVKLYVTVSNAPGVTAAITTN